MCPRKRQYQLQSQHQQQQQVAQYRPLGAARAESQGINNMEFRENTKISDIAMLGTHDAGTYNIKNLKGVSVCQHLDLVQQAEAGVQYFDLRVRKNKEGVWKFYHGEKNKGRGFNASGPAMQELDSLFDYTKKHLERLFLFKFHFDLSTDDPSAIAGFLENVRNKLEGQLIEKTESGGLLGQVTISDSLLKGKNVGILAHHAGGEVEGESSIWNYGDNTYGGWGKTPKAGQLIEHLTGNIQRENPEGKILVSQTNLPAMIPPRVKYLLNQRPGGDWKNWQITPMNRLLGEWNRPREMVLTPVSYPEILSTRNMPQQPLMNGSGTGTMQVLNKQLRQIYKHFGSDSRFSLLLALSCFIFLNAISLWLYFSIFGQIVAFYPWSVAFFVMAFFKHFFYYGHKASFACFARNIQWCLGNVNVLPASVLPHKFALALVLFPRADTFVFGNAPYLIIGCFGETVDGDACHLRIIGIWCHALAQFGQFHIPENSPHSDSPGQENIYMAFCVGRKLFGYNVPDLGATIPAHSYLSPIHIAS